MKSRSRRGVSNTIIIVAAVLIIIIVAAGIYVYITMVPPSAGPKDTLIMGTTDSVQTDLDPARAYDFFGFEMIQALGSGLVDIRPGAPNGAGPEDVIPALALNWSSTLDGLHWTFNLRQGVEFDDGTEFNATHVKYTFDRGIGIAHPEGPFVGIGYVDIIHDVQVLRKDQVRFNLNHPFSPFLSLLTSQASFIVNPKYAPKTSTVEYVDGNARASYPLDLGPYNLTKWVRTAGRDQEIRLAANPNYWNTSGGFPKTKNIIISFFSDATALRLAIEGGDVDIAFRQLRASDINDLKTKTTVKVWQGTGASIQYMVFQCSDKFPPFNDTRVRRAVAAAINRTALTQTVFLGQASPLYSMIPNGMTGHADAFKTLGDANYTFTKNTLNDPTIWGGPYNSTHKLQVDLWYEISGHYQQSADQGLVLKNSLDASGVITVSLNGLDWAAYRSKTTDQDMPVYMYGWYPDYVDADDYAYPFLHSSGGSWLFDNYNSTQMDNLITWARGNTSAITRNNLYAQIQNLNVKDTPMVPIYQSSAWAVTKPDVKGVYLDITQNWRHWLVYSEG